MTAYTSIANGAVDAGSPIDEALVTALRDNPLAIGEGDATAPKIATIAADANDGSSTAGTTAAITNSVANYTALGSSTTATVLQGVVNIAGAYTFKIANGCFYNSGGGANLTVRIYCDVTLVASATTSANGPLVLLTASATHTASAGDVWYVNYTGDNGSETTNNCVTVTISTDSAGDCFTRVTDGALVV